ncbi:hypothetical protein [Candidatus Schmidhempelia bombi]|uniref:Uncharacterized protein n=1 Tax=Candidatus Schmidhempelia bombi str. Bimp TaxID=1387197 RepID=A0AB94IA87_9GAMM|nr:hypothetical protein [Candidatus Schmidhempelia bombi]TEA26294.1 hypothetical protein O970_09420 [Candidatus Schmidhempelia bombi str. Bimp]
MKRASESQLPQLAHIELFTCDDLPAFINQSQALADRLPDNEKTVILVEKQAQLIQAHKPAGFLRAGLGITFIGNPSHYYVRHG